MIQSKIELVDGDCPDLDELLAKLPGPRSSRPCHVRFFDADFRSVDIAWEVLFTRNTDDAWMEYVGKNRRSRSLRDAIRILSVMN